jgi:hypothetical protein
MAPAEKGTCSESLQRYAYNVNMAKCLVFEYSGCEGNLNNFATINDCEATCDILIQMSRQTAGIFSNSRFICSKISEVRCLYFQVTEGQAYEEALKRGLFLIRACV